jgi:site-specific DNA recombinase
MQRLTRELAEAETQIKTAKVATSEVEDTLSRALVAASHCERAYLTAPGHVKRQINRGFFEKLYINQDGLVEHAALTEPFAALSGTLASQAIETGTVTKSESGVTERDVAFIGLGLKDKDLVPPTGFEPALNRF